MQNKKRNSKRQRPTKNKNSCSLARRRKGDSNKGIKITQYIKITKQMNLLDSITTKKLTQTDLLIYNDIKNNTVNLTFQDRMDIIIEYRQKLEQLRKIPVITQRTPEWYAARTTRLTASDLEEAISNNNLKLAKKKAGILKDTTNYATIPPLKWGTMFEPMAARCYSQELDDIEIHEFGLLADPDLEHFGASPDGINDMGIMIEIKCPYSREIIDNKIPHKYYMQIQGQLAVCGLQECDYIECDFVTYDNFSKYLEDCANITKHHGIIAEYKRIDIDEYYYIYSDPYLSPEDAYDDINHKMRNLKEKNIKFIKQTYWKLHNINVQRVTFDKDLWNTTIPKIQAFWDKVEECKQLPVEQTAPKVKKIMFIEDDD